MPLFGIRDGTNDDRFVLEAMLLEAFFWRSSEDRPTIEEFGRTAKYAMLLEDWGMRDGDTAIIAEIGDRAVGAVWYRYWTHEQHSYGFVDPIYPELGIAVAPEYRAQGIGGSIMERFCAAADARGVPGISLSVDPANFAMKLYERVGFREVGRLETSVTMLRMGRPTLPEHDQ